MLRQSTELFLINSQASAAKENEKEFQEAICNTYDTFQTNKDFSYMPHKRLVSDFFTIIENNFGLASQLENALANKLILSLLMIYQQASQQDPIGEERNTNTLQVKTEEPHKRIYLKALMLLSKLCRYDERLSSLLIKSLTAEESESSFQLADMRLNEDLVGGDSRSKMIALEFGQTVIRASCNMQGGQKLLTMNEIFGNSQKARDLMHAFETLQLGQLMKKMNNHASIRGLLEQQAESPLIPESFDFYNMNLDLQSQGSDRRNVHKKKIFSEEKEINNCPKESSYSRLLCHTPSFASNKEAGLEEFQEMKIRINELETICTQQNEMITIAIKDLYRHSKDMSEQALKAAERLCKSEIEEYKAQEAINRSRQGMHEQMNQPHQAQQQPVQPRNSLLSVNRLVSPRESNMQVTDTSNEARNFKRNSSQQIDELPIHRRMANLEKIIAFQTQETVEEMQKKLEKSFRQEIKQSQRSIQKEVQTKLQELKEFKRSKTLSSEGSQEYAIDDLPSSISQHKANPNQNLSINIRVGNEKRQSSNAIDRTQAIDAIKERVEFVYQSQLDLSEELRKKLYAVSQKLMELEGSKAKDALTPILQITDHNQVQQPPLVQHIGGSQFRKTAANSSLGVKNNRTIRVLSPVMSSNIKEPKIRYPQPRKTFDLKSTINNPGSIKLLPPRDGVQSPLRNNPRRHITPNQFYRTNPSTRNSQDQ